MSDGEVPDELHVARTILSASTNENSSAKRYLTSPFVVWTVETRKISRLTHLHPLALDQALRVRQNPEHHVLYRALLLEDHSGQVQQHLVPLDFELRLLVEVSVPQPDSAKLQVTGEYLLVLLREGGVAELIYDLQPKRLENILREVCTSKWMFFYFTGNRWRSLNTLC